MITGLTVFHCIISILLIVTVLLQFGKGAEAGLLMDAGASSILPQKGNVMTKITTVLAILFLSISLALAVMRSHQARESIFDKRAPTAGPLGLDPGPSKSKDAVGDKPTTATTPAAPASSAAPAATTPATAPTAPAAPPTTK